MTKDYVLFIHGVNVREGAAEKGSGDYEYPKQLFSRLQVLLPALELVTVPLYWENVNEQPLAALCEDFQGSSVWPMVWFQAFRKKQILQFAGDAALYISRHVGSQAVRQLKEQFLKCLAPRSVKNERLHLVTHSWGTIILFDILFASRWDEPKIPGYQDVQELRQMFFGLEPSKGEGIPISYLYDGFTDRPL